MPADNHVLKEHHADEDYEATAEAKVEHEEAEEPVISPAYTIVDPGTVVVHLQNAAVADTAMVTPGWLQAVALLALFHLSKLFHL